MTGEVEDHCALASRRRAREFWKVMCARRESERGDPAPRQIQTAPAPACAGRLVLYALTQAGSLANTRRL